MYNRATVSISVIALATLVACAAPTNRVGRKAVVQFGVVQSAEEITLDSAAPQGALLGGTLGLVAGRGDMGTAIKGAALGGVATAAGQGNRTGFAYTVRMVDGSSTRIVSDQREIHPGDCVAIERVGNNANIRRASAGYCDPGNSQAVSAVQESTQSEALKCQSAKQELAAATNAEEADLATRKIELLCYG